MLHVNSCDERTCVVNVVILASWFLSGRCSCDNCGLGRCLRGVFVLLWCQVCTVTAHGFCVVDQFSVVTAGLPSTYYLGDHGGSMEWDDVWQTGKCGICDALQLEAARRRAIPIRFSFVAHAKLEVAQPIHCHLITFLLLRHCITLWLWTLTCDRECLYYTGCAMVKLCTKFERN